MARASNPLTAPRGLVCDCGNAHPLESCAIKSDSKQPIPALKSGASASWCVKAGARLERICGNLDCRSGAGTWLVTMSSRYTTDDATSLLTKPLSAVIYWPSSESSAAKYAVGVGSLFCVRRVSSIALRTTEDCCWFCSLGDERILSSLSCREDILASVVL